LVLSNIVPAVGLSSYLHFEQRRENGFFPGMYFRLPHFLQE